MGTRMEKYKKKKENKSRKKLKTITLMFLVMFLILELNMLDNKLRSSTNTNEKTMYSLSLNQGRLDLELFGNKYYLNKKEIDKLLENLKGKMKSIKDQSALVF